MMLLIWMLFIFILSTDAGSETHTMGWTSRLIRYLFPDIGADGLKLASKIIRKAAHVTEYAIMAFLLAGSLRSLFAVYGRRLALWTIAFCAVFAGFDELHQSFVGTRTPLPSDAMIDTSGAALGVLIFFLFNRMRQSSITKNVICD
ncbi:MAG: VanZ family protein [bacterium]|nr:VanZ family protein [bacterium]